MHLTEKELLARLEKLVPINLNLWKILPAAKPSARTIGIDVVTHKLYLPAAKTEPATTTAGGAGQNKYQCSFHIIEVGK